jgi:hypothetical protein
MDTSPARPVAARWKDAAHAAGWLLASAVTRTVSIKVSYLDIDRPA